MDWRRLVLVFGLVACEPAAPEQPASPAPPASLPAGHLVAWRSLEAGSFGAIRAVVEPDRPLRLSFEAPPPPNARYELERPGQATVTGRATVEGRNVALAFEGPPAVGSARLVVRLGEASFGHEVRFQPGEDPRPEVRAAKAACRKGEADAGLATLEGLLAAAAAPNEANWLWVEKARCLQAARRNEPAMEAWISAAAGARAAGLPAEASRRLRAAAFVAIQARRFVVARRLLDETGPLDANAGPAGSQSTGPAVANEDGLARTAYYLGLLEGELGNVRQAVAHSEEAARLWSGIGLTEEAGWAQEWLVHQYQRAGNYRRAAQLLNRLPEPPESKPSERARFLHNRAWFHLQEMQRGDRPADYPAVRHDLESARALFTDLGESESAAEASKNLASESAAEASVNLAWVAFLSGDRASALAGLAAVEKVPGGLPPFSAAFVRLLRGDLALASASPKEALAAFERAAAAALEEAGGLDSEERWRALYGQGRARSAAEDAAGAGAAYSAALDALDRIGQRTLLRDTRAAFFDDRHALFDDAVSLALARRQPELAFEIVMRNQGRILRGLESSVRTDRLSPAQRALWDEKVEAWVRARESWEEGRHGGDLLSSRKLAAWRTEREAQRVSLSGAFDAAYGLLDQAAPETGVLASGAAVRLRLAPDEALLDFVMVRGRPHVFLVTAGEVSAHVVEGHESTETLLAAVAGALVGRQHLFIVPGEVAAARALPVAGLLDGQPLWKSHSASLLPHAGMLTRWGPSAAQSVVIVSDPEENLPSARAEGLALAGRFPGAQAFLGALARRTPVLAAIDSADLFHFSGHGVTRPEEPWDAHLGLALDQTLTLTDVLVARPHPRVVVLSGCETGAAGLVGTHETVGLPDAFLSGGAGSVLATERAVGDAEARAFVQRFYAAGGAATPAAAYRRAIAQSVAANESGHEAFRLFGGR